MAGDSKDEKQVNTGGGVYVGGDVKIERGDFVGRDKITTKTEPRQQGVTPEEFLKLLVEMRALVPQSGLDERTAKVIEGEVDHIEDEAKQTEPNGAILVGKLKGVTETLKAAKGLTDAGQKLLPLLERGASWVSQLF